MYEKSLITDARLDAVQEELIWITWRMLEAIHTGDAETYAEYTAPDLSCFEDVCDHRIDGLEFHIALIRQMAQDPSNRPTRFDILSPRVQVYGETGIVTYTRLMTYDNDGKPRWSSVNESRVFIKRDGRWRMVHFHRTPV
jgi:calcium/calmodulin-dependent protein kinase (CaM kinase) II